MASTGKTITQRIAIDGGKEIEVQLKSLGDTGATTFKRIQQAAQDASGFGAQFAASIAQLKVNLESLSASASKLSSQFSATESSLRTVETRMASTAVAVSAVVAGFAALVIKAGLSAEEIEKGASAAQLSTKDYQELRNTFVAGGVGADTFDTLMKRLNKSFGDNFETTQKLKKAQNDLSDEFASGKINSEQYSASFLNLQKNARENVDVFNQLGVTFQSVGGDSKTALLQVLEQINKIPPGIERANAELKVFGRSGTEVDIMVKEFGTLFEQTKRIVPVLNEMEITIGVKMSRAITLLGLVADGAQKKVLAIFQPEVTLLANALTSAITRNLDSIIEFAAKVDAAIRPVINDIAALLNGDAINPDGLVAKVVSAFNDIAAAAKIMFDTLAVIFNTISAALDPVARLINKIFGTDLNGRILAIIVAVGALSGAFTAIASVVTLAVTAFGFLLAAFALLGPLELPALFLLLGAALGALGNQFKSVRDIFDSFVEFFVDGFKTLDNIINGFIDLCAKAIDAVKSLFSATGASGANGSDQGLPQFAAGGHIRGPGSGTSDSILAMVSDGEHITKASAVSYYGPRFMDAINQMRIPRHILAGLAGFANGGMVRAMSSSIPRFADGGMVHALSQASGGNKGNLTLRIGDEVFTGITAEDRTFDKLSRFANRKAITTGGRKPGWVT